ncbi:glycine/betaine ABC transporter [Malaciobacter halophilus]|uniref:Glycine/betaine ABC transporter n=1 Tax=Malaciobacter halophilus TaxID=197482 RepID=A0A2N1J0F2_9BACT|nr:BCCT family transporter [Malaciobacter halophilus]AXH10368.1 BCCT (betaine/carnitine/choline) family transporter [Malaciobacter halophilus]PKI80035.1 glycine/betaine ABC transporter [Malaciobacter halophilus]
MSKKYVTDYEIGQDNLQKFGLDIHNPVFIISALIILAFVIVTLIYPASANETLDGAKWWAINNFDWLFMSSSNIFVIFCIVLIFLPVSKIRIGGRDAKPEFSNISWFAMLFAAGMGIGLMFWSVAEPVAYYTAWWHTPLNVEANTPQAKELAMGATMFHWGLHPWAIYAIVGLSLAFFSYSKKLPLTMRSAFYPILGEKVWGWPGHLIDILAVFATIFGLATSLGLGAQQVAAGLNFLFDISKGINTQIWIIVAITSIAVISVVRGLEGGVKILSNLNIILAFVLISFLLFVGPTLDIFKGFGNTVSAYATNMFDLGSFTQRDDKEWFHGWTIFYWAWWIAWSPFVGMFIARVSKGRTVREFIIAVLLIPTLITAIWMSAFGTTGLEQVINNTGELANGITDKSLAMFQMFENLPLSSITSSLAIFLVIVFFVTSSDSGSLVIDSITAGGKLDAPTAQRVFWAVVEGGVAISLLYIGGKQALNALQAGSITTALPFTLILLVMCFSLYKGLNGELKHLQQQEEKK